MKLRFNKPIKILVIILCSMLVVVIWENRKKLSPNNVLGFIQESILGMRRGTGFPYKIIGNKVSKGNFVVLNGDVVVMSDTSLFCLNSSAKEISNRQHSFSSPVLKVGDNRMLAYSLYGSCYQVESKTKTILSKVSEKNIMSGAISHDGVYGLITESSGYLCEMTIYSEDGESKLYKYYFSEYYMIAMDFNENGDKVSVIGYSAENGIIKSVLYVFDYFSGSPKAKIEYDDVALLDVVYLSDGNVMVVGDSLISVVHPNTSERKDYQYDEKKLTAFDVNKSDGIVFSLSSFEDGSKCELLRINKKGEVVAQTKTNERIVDVSYHSGTVMAISYDKILRYNSSLDFRDEKESRNDSKKIQMTSQDSAYVLCIGEIRKISF